MSRSIALALMAGGAIFMQMLDGAVINVALPSIAGTFGVTPLHLNFAITVYLLSGAMVIPLSGWLADRYGARTVFTSSMLMFTCSSLLCALSQTYAQFIGARILQGVGGALMVPLGRTIVMRATSQANFVRATSSLLVPALLGPLIGPPFGGLIVTHASWPWIFLINVPLGLIGTGVALRLVDNARETHVAALDLPGWTLCALAMCLLAYGLNTIGISEEKTTPALLLLLGTVAALLYVRHARRTAQPILNLGLLRIQSFRVAILDSGLTRMLMGALPFLLTLLLQVAFGLSAMTAGVISLANAVGALTMRVTAPRIVARYGYRRVMIVTTLITGTSMMAYSNFNAHTAHWMIVAALLLSGYFRSLLFTVQSSLTYVGIPRSAFSQATTLASMSMQLALSLGVGLSASLVQLALNRSSAPRLVARDLTVAFIVTGSIALLPVLSYLRLRVGGGAEVTRA